jgi:NTP pyrophosphatase (non-canonical NTP hydrolase)
MKNIKEKVLEWAELRNLLHNENALKQYSKLQEESNELLIGILNKDPYEQQDALGDCFVVLIILANQLGHDLDKCLEMAYDEIKDRTGQTISGNFVKDIK